MILIFWGTNIILDAWVLWSRYPASSWLPIPISAPPLAHPTPSTAPSHPSAEKIYPVYFSPLSPPLRLAQTVHLSISEPIVALYYSTINIHVQALILISHQRLKAELLSIPESRNNNYKRYKTGLTFAEITTISRECVEENSKIKHVFLTTATLVLRRFGAKMALYIRRKSSKYIYMIY